MIKVGIIGYGYWGPNYSRIIKTINGVKLVAVSDLSVKNLNDASKNLKVRVFSDYKDLLKESIDAVIIVTPTSTHFEIVKDALNSKRHVLCEKPLTLTSSQCHEVTQLAKRKKRVLMTGYTFIFNSAFQKLLDLIHKNILGELYYLSFTRMNLGPIRSDVNSLWDLAPHDFSMLYSITRKLPSEIFSTGGAYLNGLKEDVTFITFKYKSGLSANVTASWLAPVKIRNATIVGSKKMAVFDDALLTKKITLFDKGVKLPPRGASFFDFSKAGLKTGRITYPAYKDSEPLTNQVKHFLDCINGKESPVTDGMFSLYVSKMLEAAQKSLEEKKLVKL